jgi:hypothetical protein
MERERPTVPLLPQIASHPGIMAIDITDRFAAAVKSKL